MIEQDCSARLLRDFHDNLVSCKVGVRLLQDCQLQGYNILIIPNAISENPRLL